jgi:hypothetical protein
MINVEGECHRPSSSCSPSTRNVTSSPASTSHAEGPVFTKTEQVSDILNTAMCLQDYNIYKTVYQIYILVVDDLSGDWFNLYVPEM